MYTIYAYNTQHGKGRKYNTLTRCMRPKYPTTYPDPPWSGINRTSRSPPCGSKRLLRWRGSLKEFLLLLIDPSDGGNVACISEQLAEQDDDSSFPEFSS